MRRPVKIILGLLGALVLVLALAAIVLPLLFDSEDVKRAITREVSQRTGREFQIAGPLEISVFPWLAVKAEQLSLGNAQGFTGEHLARIGQARVGVALMPLLHRRLVADRVELRGLELNLEVNAKGHSNWEDLTSSGAAADEGSQGMFSAPQIAGLDIVDGQIEFKDRQAGTDYLVSKLDLQTGALGGGAPVPVQLTLDLADRSAGTTLALGFAADVAPDPRLQHFDLSGVKLELSPDGFHDPLVLHAPTARAGLEAGTLDIDSFTAELGELSATGKLGATGIPAAPVFKGRLESKEFKPRKLLASLGLEAPVTADPDALGRASLSAAFNGHGTQLSLTDLALDLDQSKLTGRLELEEAAAPTIKFDVFLDSMDLDRYLAPEEPSADTGATTLPGKELEGLDVTGTVHADSLRMAGLDLTDAVIGVRLVNGRLRLHPLDANLYGGTYGGDITLDASKRVPHLSLDEKLEAVPFQRLAGDLLGSQRLSGTAFGHLRAKGKGATVAKVLGNLSGDLSLNLDNGALEGVNVWYEIRRALAAYRGAEPPAPEPNRTVFSTLQLDADLSDGILQTRKLTGELPFLSLQGQGSVNLAGASMDLRLVAAVRNTPELAKDPLAGQLAGKSVPLTIRGSLGDPRVAVDWGSLLKTEAADRLLDKLLGPKPKPKTGGEPAADGQQTPAQEQETDQTRDAARALLESLIKGQQKDTGDEKEGQGGG